MTLVERRIFRINDFVDNINPAQICVEPMEDPDLDFRMYCGTDILGNITKWLAKDQKARITDLSITDRLNMNTNDVANVGSLYAPWTDLDNDVWARLRFYYNGAYPTSEFVQARPGIECGVRLDATQSKADFFCDTNRGLFFNGPEMTLKDYDADTSKYNFLLTSDSSGTVIDSEIKMRLGSAGSLSFYDANKAGYTNEGIPLSSLGQWENIVSLAGDNCTLFGAILAAGATTLQDAYNNGGSVVTSSGPTYWVWPVDGGNGSPFSIANNDTDNESAVLQIANESVNSEKYGILFSGASGDASLSGALGHKIWTADSISIGRTASTGFQSYFVANQGPFTNPNNRYTNAMIYSRSTGVGDPATEGISYVRARAGGVDEGFANAELQLYVKSGNILLDNHAGGNVTVSANVSLSGGTVRISDSYRGGSDYTGTSVPWASSTANWSAFAALAGATGSICDAFAALGTRTAALTQGHIAYGNGTGITGEAALFYDATSKCIGLNKVSPEFGLDLNGTSGKNIMLGLSGWASTNHPRLYIRSSRSGTVGSYSATLANQTVARIFVQGSSGTEHIDAMQMAVVSDVASGDWDTSDNRSAHLRISLMSSGTLTERLRIRSTGVLYGANIILADANKSGYTNEGIPLSSSGQWASIVSLAGDNCTLFGAILAASTTPVKNPNNLVLKVKSGTTEGTDLYTYNGSAAKTLDFKQGSNVTLTEAAGSLTIAATDTTYPLTQGHIAYGTGTGITGEAALFWDSANKLLGVGTTTPENGFHVKGTGTIVPTVRADCFSTTGSDVASLRMYKSNHDSTFGALASGNLIGRVRFIGSKPTTWADGCTIDALSSGSWATSAGESVDLRVQLRRSGTLATRLLLTSDSRIAVGSDAVSDWSHSQVLASQRLDGSTAGSSQSIVAMTLGLRTTSATENQVLKLTSSDSDSPLVLQAGYFYSLLVNISATFESGDKKGYVNNTYALTVFYGEVRDKALINSNTTTEYGNVLPGSFSFKVVSGVLEIWFTPSAFCSVDNPINVLATICGGTKIKTGQSQIC